MIINLIINLLIQTGSEDFHRRKLPLFFFLCSQVERYQFSDMKNNFTKCICWRNRTNQETFGRQTNVTKLYSKCNFRHRKNQIEPRPPPSDSHPDKCFWRKHEEAQHKPPEEKTESCRGLKKRELMASQLLIGFRFFFGEQRTCHRSVLCGSKSLHHRLVSPERFRSSILAVAVFCHVLPAGGSRGAFSQY